MCDVPPEREGAPRITPPLHHWETGVCALGQAVQHQLQPPDVVRNTSNTRENTPSAWWVGANMAAFCDLLIQNGYHFKCIACSETYPEQLLVSLWSGLVTEPKWRPCRDPGTSQGGTILVFLRNMNRWWMMTVSKTSTHYCRSFPKPALTQFFTHNRSFLRARRPFGWRMKEKSFVSCQMEDSFRSRGTINTSEC